MPCIVSGIIQRSVDYLPCRVLCVVSCRVQYSVVLQVLTVPCIVSGIIQCSVECLPCHVL